MDHELHNLKLRGYALRVLKGRRLSTHQKNIKYILGFGLLNTFLLSIKKASICAFLKRSGIKSGVFIDGVNWEVKILI